MFVVYLLTTYFLSYLVGKLHARSLVMALIPSLPLMPVTICFSVQTITVLKLGMFLHLFKVSFLHSCSNQDEEAMEDITEDINNLSDDEFYGMSAQQSMFMDGAWSFKLAPFHKNSPKIKYVYKLHHSIASLITLIHL